MEPIPHAYQCRCQQCRDMAAAIGAQLPDGTDAFTDAELYRLAVQRNAPCGCLPCRELHAALLAKEPASF